MLCTKMPPDKPLYVSNEINRFALKVGQKVFIGIPMESDREPFFANHFLFFYESRWLKFIKNTNYGVALHTQTGYTLYRVLF